MDLQLKTFGDLAKSFAFILKQKSRKSLTFHSSAGKTAPHFVLSLPVPLAICSYPPEDVIIEKFGDFLKKKGTQILTEESASMLPFSTSIEDGIDIRETIRHWTKKNFT